MFVVAICVGIHSLLGLPWYVAATVSALAHINSLKKESECTAPGDKPSFLGVRYCIISKHLVINHVNCVGCFNQFKKSKNWKVFISEVQYTMKINILSGKHIS